MTTLPQGPTATQLHQRTLTEEEEPRTTAIVPATGPSSSASVRTPLIFIPVGFCVHGCGRRQLNDRRVCQDCLDFMAGRHAATTCRGCIEASANAHEHEWVEITAVYAPKRTFICTGCDDNRWETWPTARIATSACWTHTYTPTELGSNDYACIKCGEPLE